MYRNNIVYLNNRLYDTNREVYLNFELTYQYSEPFSNKTENMHVYSNPETKEKYEFTDDYLSRLNRLTNQVIKID